MGTPSSPLLVTASNAISITTRLLLVPQEYEDDGTTTAISAGSECE